MFTKTIVAIGMLRAIHGDGNYCSQGARAATTHKPSPRKRACGNDALDRRSEPPSMSCTAGLGDKTMKCGSANV